MKKSHKSEYRDKDRRKKSRSRSKSKEKDDKQKNYDESFKKPFAKHRIDSNRSNEFERKTYYSSKMSASHSQSTYKSGSALLFSGSGATIKKTPKPLLQSTPILKNPRHEDNLPKNKQRERNSSNDYTAFEWEEIEKEADRDWYNIDDFKEDYHDNYFFGNEKQFKSIEEELDILNQKKRGIENLKKKQWDAEGSKWELNRLQQSGLFKINLDQIENEDEDSNRIMLMTHDIKPPFLSGAQQFTTQLEMKSIIKDPTSDFSLLAKKGSAAVQKLREVNDKSKMREKFWELAGSKLGNLLNVEKPKDEQEQQSEDKATFKDDGEVNYKNTQQFSTHLSKQDNSDQKKGICNKIKTQRESLPIFYSRQQLMRAIDENKIIIVIGETGSGKTTQLTQYLYEEGYAKNGIIGCTQPRRVAAVSVAKRVSEEMGVLLGDLVGYSIRFEDCCSEKTKIKYMTDGILLREKITDDDLEKYSAIIMDEAHERSLNTDVLFGLLKQVAVRRRDIKIIISSATIQGEYLSKFFGNIPIFNIKGRTYPVDLEFTRAPVDDYVDGCIKKALQIHINMPPGDILIFMTGQEDIEATCVLLGEQLQKLGPNTPPLLLLPIYSQLPSDCQAKIFEKSEQRKCIVATNIAETSLTLDKVRYVIDSGFHKVKVYNPKIGMDSLQIVPLSQANANQRMGRAGRTGPGRCFRMYTDGMFRTDLFEQNIPEIQRTNLANVVLLLKTLNIENLLDFDWIDPPPQDTMLNAMYQLWVLGALDNIGQLTEQGRRMADFPVDPPLARIILSAEKFGCVEEIITVVAMLSVPAIFYRPKDRESESDLAREKLCIPESDHLTYLNVYEQWKKHDWSSTWCTKHFINVKSMRKVREIRSQLKDIFESQKVELSSAKNNYDIVRKAICSGYFTNASRMQGIGEYVNLRTGVPCKLHPSSALFTLGYVPDYVVYHEIVMTSKEYMQCVTAVDPCWLAELGPMFFSIKQTYGSRQEKQEIEKIGLNIIEDQINEAKKLQEEKEKKSKEIEEKDKLERRMKSELVIAGPGRLKTPLLKTPHIQHQ